MKTDEEDKKENLSELNHLFLDLDWLKTPGDIDDFIFYYEKEKNKKRL